MKLNSFPTLVHALDYLRGQGYKHDFKYQDQNVVDLSTGRAFDANQMYIVEHYRFDSLTTPSEIVLLFAVETEDGIKGTIVSSYGPYADIKLIEFLDKVRIKGKKRMSLSQGQHQDSQYTQNQPSHKDIIRN